jgi:hypothetical protein
MAIVATSLAPRTYQHDAIRAMHDLAPSRELLYAVRTRDGLIKIGFTTDLVNRMQGIEGGVTEVLAFKPGGRADELKIHRSLDGHAAHGREYYHPTPSVLRVVNEMRAGLGLDPIVQPRRFAA